MTGASATTEPPWSRSAEPLLPLPQPASAKPASATRDPTLAIPVNERTMDVLLQRNLRPHQRNNVARPDFL